MPKLAHANLIANRGWLGEAGGGIPGARAADGVDAGGGHRDLDGAAEPAPKTGGQAGGQHCQTWLASAFPRRVGALVAGLIVVAVRDRPASCARRASSVVGVARRLTAGAL